MGINDREYIRREGPSFLGSFVDRGTICKWLIGINVVVFVIQIVTGVHGRSPFTDALELNVDRAVFHGEVWRLLTYAFLHDPGDILHILFNMLLLYWFGCDMEEMYGPREFLIFYLVSAVVGGAAFSVAHLIGFPANLCIGASGAVTAVLVLTAFHYPRRIIYLMFFLPVPIWLFVVGSVAYDAYTLLANQESMVAVAVHLGGAGVRLLLLPLQLADQPGACKGCGRTFAAWRKRATRPRLARLPRGAAEPERGRHGRAGGGGVERGEDRIKAEMDAVLEKISRVGRENLTESDLRRVATRQRDPAPPAQLIDKSEEKRCRFTSTFAASARKRATGPRLRVYREEPPRRSEAVTAVPAAVASNAEEDRIKAEMDAVLEKISRVGRDNLTADNLDVLRRTSEILRARRS